jgi:hypothetical protein
MTWQVDSEDLEVGRQMRYEVIEERTIQPQGVEQDQRFWLATGV